MILVQQPQLPVTHLNLYFSQPRPTTPTGRTVALHTLAQRQLLRGTRHRDRAQLMRDLGLLGADVTLTQRRFAHSVNVTALSRQWSSVMTLLTEMLAEPRWCPDELAQSKRIYQAELAARYDMDAALAWLWLTRRIARDHSWLRAGASVTAADIESISAEEITEVWPDLFDNARMLPCLSSDLSVDQLSPAIQALGHALSGESSEEPALTPIEPLKSRDGASLTLIHKADRQQAQIFIAQPTISPHHPDYLALYLAVCALGGTFSSPLMQEVRVKRGLSYGAQAGIRGEGHARYLTLHATPDAQDAAETTHVMHAVLTRAAEGGLRDEEIAFAKSYLINAHPFNIETATMRATMQARATLQGLDPDELFAIPERLAPLTPERVREVAARHLTPDATEVLIFGDQESAALSSITEDLGVRCSFKETFRADARDDLPT